MLFNKIWIKLILDPEETKPISINKITEENITVGGKFKFLSKCWFLLLPLRHTNLYFFSLLIVKFSTKGVSGIRLKATSQNSNKNYIGYDAEVSKAESEKECVSDDRHCKIDFEKGEATYIFTSLFPGQLYAISVKTFFIIKIDNATNKEFKSENKYAEECTGNKVYLN